ncbi:hypothetical protein PTTG_03099 [Puccinia triticina 1-1 BBBD Race 1]|uniref:Uncharacterized protein n=1 Tax=Puccinia triticina (isolate 1-1 / race 1 (BBBD)) TaxID=630390 RepID=A0A180GQD0_PUCT1|nr:hypothetical protein PTTG_03099 [Puccinia triticina 1-1 BBBD Race 1]WAR61636.1 hypothetical protein PtB15_12B326 [Puccinia triticina]
MPLCPEEPLAIFKELSAGTHSSLHPIQEFNPAEHPRLQPDIFPNSSYQAESCIIPSAMKLFAIVFAAGLFLAQAPADTSATCLAARDVAGNIKELKSGSLNRRSCFDFLKKKKDDDYEKKKKVYYYYEDDDDDEKHYKKKHHYKDEDDDDHSGGYYKEGYYGEKGHYYSDPKGHYGDDDGHGSYHRRSVGDYQSGYGNQGKDDNKYYNGDNKYYNNDNKNYNGDNKNYNGENKYYNGNYKYEGQGHYSGEYHSTDGHKA